MNTDRSKRKLTAILSADVKGYSQLMQDDEDATVRTITAYRDVMTNLIIENSGRVVDAKGDNLLAEFPSVVDAIRSSVEIQTELKVRNEQLPEHRKMAFRIGINSGDVIEEEETIYGNGVNVAARLEGLAEGGGICISGTAFDQIGKKLPLGYEYLGEQQVKNIEKPVRVFRVMMEPNAAGKVIGEEKLKPRKWRWAAVGAVVALLVVGAIWNFYLRRPSVEAADPEKMAYPLPDKPSIAVLPFDNLSDDPAQENIVDGITDAIITGLSKTPEMFVIARNSVFTYKGKPVKVKQVSEDLGVRYVLEGSVQKEGDRLRINAQLIDAVNGHHLWAEKYDRDMKEIFALQDDITMKVITELQVNLTEGEHARVLAKGTENIEAYLKCNQAVTIFRRITKESNLKSRKMLEEVIALDPNYPIPYVYLGYTYLYDVMLWGSKSPKEDLARAEDLAQNAIELDASLGVPHRLLGVIFKARKQWDKGLKEAERAVSIDPNVQTMYGLALYLRNAGRHEESIAWYEKAFRLDPFPPAAYISQLGVAYFLAERYEDALSQLRRVLELAKKGKFNLLWAHLFLAQTNAMLGQEEEARAHAEEVLRINPKFSLEQSARRNRRIFKNQADVDHQTDALRKAGLSD